MIRYALKCPKDHGFESWFQSAAAFEGLAVAGMLVCPICGDARIEKTLMAPALGPTGKGKAPPATADAAAVVDGTGAKGAASGPLSTPSSDMEVALTALKREIEKNSDYVGMNFATEARRIHAGNAPERAIHGEAKPEEARKLIEDGIPVAPLPFMPARKVN